MKLEQKEFEGNILVTISDKEVRLWICNESGNIFRFKATGEVHQAGQDITILPPSKLNLRKRKIA